MWCAHHKICFFDFQGTDQGTDQEERVRISRDIRDARVAPPEALRRVSLEIDFSGLSGGKISALAVDQVYLVGPETPIRARKGSGLAEI